jgi:hypothetical protein
MIASRAAPTPKSLFRQRVEIALYQIHPPLHEQNPMSRECGHGSSYQVVFFTNQRVLKVYSLGWLIERFFLETVGVEYASLSAAADIPWPYPSLTSSASCRGCAITRPSSLALYTIALPDVAQPHSIRVVRVVGRNCMIQPQH